MHHLNYQYQAFIWTAIQCTYIFNDVMLCLFFITVPCEHPYKRGTIKSIGIKCFDFEFELISLYLSLYLHLFIYLYMYLFSSPSIYVIVGMLKSYDFHKSIECVFSKPCLKLD